MIIQLDSYGQLETVFTGGLSESYDDLQTELLRNINNPTIWYIMPYNRDMNNKQLKSFYNGQVLMNETASKDPVVRLALDAMAKRNFQALEVPTGGTWYISDRH